MTREELLAVRLAAAGRVARWTAENMGPITAMVVKAHGDGATDKDVNVWINGFVTGAAIAIGTSGLMMLPHEVSAFVGAFEAEMARAMGATH